VTPGSDCSHPYRTDPSPRSKDIGAATEDAREHSFVRTPTTPTRAGTNPGTAECAVADEATAVLAVDHGERPL